MQEKIKYSEQSSIEANLIAFKERENVTRVLGVIGGSEDVSPINIELLTKVFSSVKTEFGRFAVQTGGTRGGVIEAGIDIARSLNLPTIGVYPKLGEKYSLKEKLDLAISVEAPPYGGQIWGSETPVLVAIPDVFILVGGEWGTAAEVAVIMKRNRDKMKQKLLFSPIIAIKGSGKFADEMEALSTVLSTYDGTFFSSYNPQEISKIVLSVFRR